MNVLTSSFTLIKQAQIIQMCLSSLTLPAESDVKMEGREEELGGEEGGEEGEERKGKQTSWSQEHLLALRKESEESVANRNLTKSPSTGLTKYLTGTDHLLRVAFSFEIHDTQIYSFLFFCRQLRKAGVESHTDGLSSNLIWGQTFMPSSLLLLYLSPLK